MAKYVEKFIYSPDEVILRNHIQHLFKSGYSHDELVLLLQRAIFKLLLEEWALGSLESQEMLGMTQQRFTGLREMMGFQRDTSDRLAASRRAHRNYYHRHTKPKRIVAKGTKPTEIEIPEDTTEMFRENRVATTPIVNQPHDELKS